MSRMLGLVLGGCLAAACGDNLTDKTAACVVSSAATIEDRKVIGPAAPYVPDLALATREAELEASIALRRQAAWRIVEQVVRPVDVAGFEVPAWHTWYARDDFERVFKHLYRELSSEGRAARSPIDGAAGLAWNANALDDDPAWPAQRYLDYLAAIDTQAAANGIGGASRVGYSPGAMTHLLESYAKQNTCRAARDPAPFETDPVRPGHPVRETARVDVAACELRVIATVQAGADEVHVTARGDGDVDLYVRRGAPPTRERYDCISDGDRDDEDCRVAGAGTIFVAVFGATAGHADVTVEYLAEDVRDPACLDGEMPRDGVVVKADWRRELPGEPLPVYDTDAATLAARLAGDASWTARAAAEPSPAQIYTAALPSGARFRMPALHVMSKELDHWAWITLWYSDSPDHDFGADRPASITGVWRNYKMCVATSYVEHDPDARGGQAGTLGDAIAAVHGGDGAPTWCSNPYLEEGTGNAATNCIGCHQHGGSTLAPEAILATPGHGTTRARNNFFTDYLWVIKGGNGEDLSSIVKAEIDFWDASE